LACAFAPDGNTLLSASFDNTLKLWDTQSGDCIRTLEGHQNSVLACAFAPDGNTLLSASDDKTLKLWNAQSGICLRNHICLPDGNHATLTEQEIISASPNAWRYLGWRETRSDRIPRLWPAEINGPLPTSANTT
jgi:WD40 repeat protein